MYTRRMARPQLLAQEITSILKKHHLLSSRQLLEHLTRAGKSYNKTSIYRALETLSSEGKICGHDFSGAEVLYELREHHHDHVVCTDCGSIAETSCSSATPETVQGYQIEHHHLTLFGLCPTCQRTRVTK